MRESEDILSLWEGQKDSLHCSKSSQAINAFATETLQEFGYALIDFRDDNDSGVGVITGTGDKDFVAIVDY